jgi:hypothetical protein
VTTLDPDRRQIETFVDALLRYRGKEGYVSLRSFLGNNALLKPIRTVRLKDAGRKGDRGSRPIGYQPAR